MRFSLVASLYVSCTAAVALPRQYGNTTTWIPGSTAGTDALAREGLIKLATYLQTNASVLASNQTCTLDNAYRRKEWDTLLPTEKKEYIKAVRCLQTLPSVSGDEVPGARTRYDDFVAVHLNLTAATETIHNTGNFLTWHRYFLWAYEEALRNECNYTGYRTYPRRYIGTQTNDLQSPMQTSADILMM